MPRHAVRLVCLASLCLVLTIPVTAQVAPTSPAPAHVSTVDGRATVDRNGRTEQVLENTPLVEGDRLSAVDGRVSLLLPDGSALHLDRGTSVEVRAEGRLALHEGRVVAILNQEPSNRPGREIQMDTAAGAVRLLAAGDYRVSVVSTPRREVRATVVRGEALLLDSRNTRPLQTGDVGTIVDGVIGEVGRMTDAVPADAFYAWSEQEHREHLGGRSAAYLPPQLHPYGTIFDREGTWDRVPQYGWVWYPRVSPDWRPYYDGAWRPYQPWGWTWIGSGRWAWPTHHYGRWGHAERGWFWIPGSVWAPAWVSWGSSSNYVSWCPLGFDDRPVFDFATRGRRKAPWRGWTLVPHTHFGGYGRVPTLAVRGDQLESSAWLSFSMRDTAPALPPMAVSPRRWSAGGMELPAWGGMPRPGTRDATLPYSQAEAVARERRESPSYSGPDRPNVGQRQWSTDPWSPYGRAQERAFERPGVDPSAVGGAPFNTTPFMRPSEGVPRLSPWFAIDPWLLGGWRDRELRRPEERWGPSWLLPPQIAEPRREQPPQKPAGAAKPPAKDKKNGGSASQR